MNKSAQHKIDNFFDVCQRNVDTLSPEKVKEKQSRYLDEEKIKYFALKLEKFLLDNPDFAKRYNKDEEDLSEPAGNCIYFHKLRSQIIGAYGQFEILEQYYRKYGWKYKVADLITQDGRNLGPGCIFSLKQSGQLLSAMEKDGWNIGEIADLVNSMKELVKQYRNQKDKNRRKKKEKTTQVVEQEPPIKFLYLSDDQFVIYGEDSIIEQTLDELKYDKKKVTLDSIGIEKNDNTEGFLISYKNLLPFINLLRNDYDVTKFRKWALSYSNIIVNTEEEATMVLRTTKDINKFFVWCYKNQEKLYAGTLHQKYLSLINNGRLRYFLTRLSKFFAFANRVSPQCKKWFMEYIPSLDNNACVTNRRHNTFVRIIYTPMGGLNKR